MTARTKEKAAAAAAAAAAPQAPQQQRYYGDRGGLVFTALNLPRLDHLTQAQRSAPANITCLERIVEVLQLPECADTSVRLYTIGAPTAIRAATACGAYLYRPAIIAVPVNAYGQPKSPDVWGDGDVRAVYGQLGRAVPPATAGICEAFACGRPNTLPPAEPGEPAAARACVLHRFINAPWPQEDLDEEWRRAYQQMLEMDDNDDASLAAVVSVGGRACLLKALCPGVAGTTRRPHWIPAWHKGRKLCPFCREAAAGAAAAAAATATAGGSSSEAEAEDDKGEDDEEEEEEDGSATAAAAAAVGWAHAAPSVNEVAGTMAMARRVVERNLALAGVASGGDGDGGSSSGGTGELQPERRSKRMRTPTKPKVLLEQPRRWYPRAKCTLCQRPLPVHKLGNGLCGPCRRGAGICCYGTCTNPASASVQAGRPNRFCARHLKHAAKALR